MSGLQRKTPLKRTPMKRTRKSSIRTLRPSESIPAGEPRRFHDGRGYIRLRWLVATEQYVEEYEHRIVMGRPAGEVHHINGVKDDNRPENLLVLSKVEHAKLHEQLAKEKDLMRGDRRAPRTARGQKAARAQQRRKERDEQIAAMRRDYEDGMSTVEIGEKYGVHNSNVSRALRSRGTQMRRAVAPKGEAGLRRSKQVVHGRSGMLCERCSKNTTWGGGQVHHRLPRGMGGSTNPAIHSPSNLLLLCADCHAYVESHREEAYDAGWLVRRGAEPAETPVVYRGGELVLLTADGDLEAAPETRRTA